MKTTGLIAKSVCQPLWALLADFKVPARVHPALAPVSVHCVAIISGILSLFFMELLHQSAGRMSFTGRRVRVRARVSAAVERCVTSLLSLEPLRLGSRV